MQILPEHLEIIRIFYQSKRGLAKGRKLEERLQHLLTSTSQLATQALQELIEDGVLEEVQLKDRCVVRLKQGWRKALSSWWEAKPVTGASRNQLNGAIRRLENEVERRSSQNARILLEVCDARDNLTRGDTGEAFLILSDVVRRYPVDTIPGS